MLNREVSIGMAMQVRHGLARFCSNECVKSGRTCEGYLDSHSRLPPTARQVQTLVPRRRDVQLYAADNRVLMTPGYETSLFYNQKQWDAFQAFVMTNVPGGSLIQDEVADLTTQYATSDSSIREICSGIGALGKAFHPVMGDDYANKDWRAALEHYGRAIKAVWRVKPTTSDLPNAVLMSMLFVTFEVMAGNFESASKHHNHAVAIMDQYIDLRSEEQGVPFEQVRLSAFDTAIFNNLQRLDTDPWAPDFGPKRYRIMSRARRFPHGCRHRYDMRDMPERFGSISRATLWWRVTQHTLLHCVHELKTPGGLQDGGDSVWAECAGFLESWRSSFAPLLQSAKHDKDRNHRQWFQAVILESLYVETISALHVRQRRSANMLPDVRPLYRDLLRQSRHLAQGQRFNGVHTLEPENRIARPTIFVLFKCRDPDIVREAAEVLQTFVGGMGTADSLLYLLSCREKKTPLKALERAWGWYFTSTGCTSGASVFEYIDGAEEYF
ncbi:hypothetical protein EsH8_III_001007 [Colletotrichum jinshuiense]